MKKRTREEKYQAFLQMHHRPGAFVIPNPYDAGTARILTALGFEALATTSAGYAFSTGRRDSAPEITRADVIGNARSIVEATHLPVSADLQNGFGDRPEDCAETIRLGAEAGLVGGSIEDASQNPSQPIYDFHHAVERVAAAVEAARTYRFVLTARAENLLHGRNDLDDTLRRLQAFAAAGADVVYAPGLPNIEVIQSFCAAVDKPVNVLMGMKAGAYSVAELTAVGVKRISVGGSFARAALGAFVRAAREVKEKGTFTYAADAIPGPEIAAFMAEPNR